MHPSKAQSPILFTELGIVIEVRPRHPPKAPSPILFTELGIVIEVRPRQPLKTQFPILFTELGIVIEVRPRQPLKALSPILFTELGIVIEVRPLQLAKAPAQITLVPDLTTYFIILSLASSSLSPSLLYITPNSSSTALAKSSAFIYSIKGYCIILQIIYINSSLKI